MKNSSVYPTTENNGVNSGEPGITLQQYAAIHLRVPNSGTNWLDAMIAQSLQTDFTIQLLKETMHKVPHLSINWEKDVTNLALSLAKMVLKKAE